MSPESTPVAVDLIRLYKFIYPIPKTQHQLYSPLSGAAPACQATSFVHDKAS